MNQDLVNFIRAISANTGRVRCEAKIVHAGARTATAEGRVVDESGKLYAQAPQRASFLRREFYNDRVSSGATHSQTNAYLVAAG